MFKYHSKKYIWIIIIVGFLVYANSLFNGFVWDDEEQILNNGFVHTISSIPSFFLGSTFNTGGTGSLGGVYYRPIMMIVFTLLYQIAGPHAFLFHAFQVLLHIGVTLLIFTFFSWFFERKLAFIASLLFLVHPLNVESVSYIAAIQDVLFAFFSLLAMVIGQQKTKGFPVRQTFVVGALFFLALLSKEVAILSILIYLGYTWLYERRRLPMSLLILFFVVTLYLFLRFALAGVFFSAFHFAPIVNVPLAGRLLMIPALFTHYILLFIWPASLAVMQHWTIKDLSITSFVLPLTGMLLFIGSVLYLLLKTKSKTLLFFGGWFALSIAPYLQIFPLDMTVADRWFYFPMIGLLGILMSTIDLLIPRERIHGRWFMLITAAVILCFSIRTVVRNADWYDELSLFGHDIRISHDAFDLENNYGVALFRKGRYDEAIVHFRKATVLANAWWVNWNNLGAAYERKGDLNLAVKYYKHSLENGDYYMAYENYAGSLIKLKRYEEARTFLEENALTKFPYNTTLQQLHQYLLQQQPHR